MNMLLHVTLFTVTWCSSSAFIINKSSGNLLDSSRIRCSVNIENVCFLAKQNNEEMKRKAKEEEMRLDILQSRRKTIRSTLRSAEQLKNFRISNGFVLESDEDGKSSDSKLALTLTAFFIGVGAVILRVGGRAALASSLGLNFANENPELQSQLAAVLDYTSSMDIVNEALIFMLGWIGVKVLCFDAGAVILAFSSGILFGGVLQGALMSAVGATIGSIIAFSFAKLDTPLRKKALELFDENPSLRGIEKVVAEDGIKAVLTLRLAPILPIPIGMYNYVYGVTNVPLFDFSVGIFLGSLKPYLLDSYLGLFGKSLIEGTSTSGTEDALLLVVLGVSVLIGVFASQLATETWDSVQQEIDNETKKDGEENEILRNFLGFELPQWAIGMQLSIKAAGERVQDTIHTEYQKKVWNFTNDDIPSNLDPALSPNSPEIAYVGKGLDFAESFCEGLVFSPLLLQAYLKYSDPKLDSEQIASITPSSNVLPNTDTDDDLFSLLQLSRSKILKRIEMLDSKLDST